MNIKSAITQDQLESYACSLVEGFDMDQTIALACQAVLRNLEDQMADDPEGLIENMVNDGFLNSEIIY